MEPQGSVADGQFDTWASVAWLAEALAAELSAVTARILDRVTAGVPAYGDLGLAGEELAVSARRFVKASLTGLIDGRGPGDADLATAAQLGTRRAEQGLPVDAVIAALHVGQAALWHELSVVARRRGHASESALLAAAPTVWGWHRALTDAVVAAHAATRQAREARAISARQRLVELLLTDDPDDGPERLHAARTLDLDPTGDFVGTVVDRGTASLDVLDAQAHLRRIAGTHVLVARGARVWGLSQGGEPDEPAAQLRRLAPAATIAVGSRRATLDGARSSLTDARLALTIASPGTTTRFDECWLTATLAGSRARLGPLLAIGVEVATLHAHLADAVRAFADGGFSVSEAARRLGLHANTVAYRLDRWTELTGWNPRTFTGLAQSIAALELPDRSDLPEPSGPPHRQ